MALRAYIMKEHLGEFEVHLSKRKPGLPPREQSCMEMEKKISHELPRIAWQLNGLQDETTQEKKIRKKKKGNARNLRVLPNHPELQNSTFSHRSPTCPKDIESR
jgi:hypothetical protein